MKTTPPKVIYLFPENDGTEASPALPTELYSAAQVEKLLAIPIGRLRYWARVGLVVPSVRQGRRRLPR